MTMRHYWTVMEDDLLRELYADQTTADIAALLDLCERQVYARACRLKLKKSDWFLAQQQSGRIQRGRQDERMVRTQFRPGFVPWNRGQHYVAGGRSVVTQFKPGHKPRGTKPIGSYRICDGLLQIKVTDTPGPNHLRWFSVGRMVWEATHGPVPAGYIVVFKPGQHTLVLEEITLDRLECISRAENAKRNHPKNLHPEIARLVQLKGAITRQVNRLAKSDQTGATP